MNYYMFLCCVCVTEKRVTLPPLVSIPLVAAVLSWVTLSSLIMHATAGGDGPGCVSGGESCDLANGWLTPSQVPVGKNYRNVM